MLQRITIALTQVKAGNASENVPNEIRQIMWSLFKEKKLPKKYITINSISYKIEWILYLWILKIVVHLIP